MPMPLDPLSEITSTDNTDGLIKKHAQRTGLDEDLVRRVIGQESRGNRRAVSPKGAGGLMQLMPETAKGLGVKNVFDPDENLRGGTDYLRKQLDDFGDVNLALAAYNAGPGAVKKYGNKVPRYSETQNYVKKIGGDYKGTGYAQDPLSEITGGQQTQAQTDPLSEITSSVHEQQPLPPAPLQLGAGISANLPPRRHPRPPIGMGDVQQASRLPDPSIADIRMADNPSIGFNRREGQPSTVTATADELRVMKGEQPTNRQAYARQQEAQSRLGQMHDLGLAQHDPQAEAQWQMANGRAITAKTKQYKDAISRAGKRNLVGGQWGSEVAAKTLAGWGELLAGATGSDDLRINTEAMRRAAMELGANRNQASAIVNEALSGLTVSAPEFAAMAAGLPPSVVFAGGGALRAGGRGEDPNKAALSGLGQAAAFDLPVPHALEKGLVGAVSKGGVTAAGSTLSELAMGKPLGEAAMTGLNTGLMRGIPEAAKAQEFYHKDWGRVVRLEDQSGARRGRTKVAEVDNPEAIHYPKTAQLSGSGNIRMVPIVKSTESSATGRAEFNPSPLVGEQLPTEGAGSGRSLSTFPRTELPISTGGVNLKSASTTGTSFRESSKGDFALEGAGSQVGDVNAPLSQASPDRILTHAEPFRSLADSESFRNQGFRGLDVPTQRVVMDSMFQMVNDPQIRDVVVKFVPVDVVNILSRAKSSSDVVLHDGPMLPDVLAVQGKNAVPLSVEEANSFVRGIARMGTELSRLDRTDSESLSALDTGTSESGNRPHDTMLTEELAGSKGIRGTTPADIARIDTAREEAAAQVERRATPLTDKGTIEAEIHERLTRLGYSPEEQATMSVNEKAAAVSGDVRRSPNRASDAEWEAMSPEMKSAVKMLRPSEGATETTAETTAPPQAEAVAAPTTTETPATKGGPTPATPEGAAGDITAPSKPVPEFVRAARERMAQTTAQAAETIGTKGAKKGEAGATGITPQEILDTVIVRGYELYTEKVKPTFEEWSRRLREEIGPKANDHLRRVWAQLQGETTPTAAKNASMQADRAEFGLDALPRPATKKDVDLLESAKDAHKSDPTEAARIADKVLNNKHTLSDKETLQLDLRAQEVKNTHDKVMKELAEATDDATITAKAANAEALEAEFNKLSEAAEKSGTEQGRAFRSRRLTINENFDLLPMLARAKKARGRELRPEERTKIKEQQEQIAQLTKDLEAALDRNKSERIQKEIDKAKRGVRRGETREKLDADAAIIKQNIIAEIARLRAGQSSTHSLGGLGNLDPEGVISRELVKYFRNRAQAHVKLNAEALVDEVHSLVSDLGVDKRAVRDLLSGYSIEQKTKRTAEQKRIDDLRNELKAMSHAEDVEAGRVSPHAEGPKLSEAPKQGPKVTDAPKLGPRDTWPARRKAIEKQIAEYERKIAEGDFSKKNRPEPIIHTRESKQLDDKLQRVKSAYNLANERAEKWHGLKTAGSIRKSGLLSGYITHVRNILGTGGYIGFEEARRVPSVFADALMAPIKDRRTVTLSPSATLDGAIHAVTEGFRGGKQILKHGATPEQMERQQLREINTGIKAIDTATNFVFRFMSASDHVFYQGSYKRNLVERAQAQAKTEARADRSINWRERAKELIDNPPKQLEADAKHDALVSTFNNNNRLSDMVKSARARAGAGGNFALDLVLPFDRTPTNVIARVIEASPLGYGKNVGQIAKSLWRREFTAAQQRAIAETFGRATTGSAIMLLGGALAAKGLLETDDYGTTYLKFRGRKINLSAVAPLGTMLSVGAGLYKQWKNPDATKRNYAGAVTKPLVDQPLLKASSQVSDLVKDPNRNLRKFGANLAFSAVPFSGAVRTAAQAADPEERRYPSKQSFKEQFQTNIPRWRQSLDVSPSPAFRGTTTSTPGTKEIERLGMRVVGASIKPDETAEEFETRKSAVNPAIVREINRIVTTAQYKNLPDEDKRPRHPDKKQMIRGIIRDENQNYEDTQKGRRPSRRSGRSERPSREARQ